MTSAFHWIKEQFNRATLRKWKSNGENWEESKTRIVQDTLQQWRTDLSVWIWTRLTWLIRSLDNNCKYYNGWFGWCQYGKKTSLLQKKVSQTIAPVSTPFIRVEKKYSLKPSISRVHCGEPVSQSSSKPRCSHPTTRFIVCPVYSAAFKSQNKS